jgi:hypothetical protein
MPVRYTPTPYQQHYTPSALVNLIGPRFTGAQPSSVVTIAGTLCYLEVIDGIISSDKVYTSGIKGKWESFISQLHYFTYRWSEASVRYNRLRHPWYDLRGMHILRHQKWGMY